ncbi:hypothetical protein FB451DRAFT_1226068 [Mycena latifolia]|nr:hypothetical protein FB451DRAFT_1226068 [Mycena latifolia]
MVDGTPELAKETILLNCTHLVGISLLFWDHLITLDKEIMYIWMRKKSSSSLWFFLVRYVALASNITVLLFSFMTLSPKGCKHFSFVHQIVLILNQLLVGIVMILRTYALYGRDKRVLGSLIIISGCILGVGAWAMYGQQSIPVTIYPGCHLGMSATSGYHISVAWAALFLFDSLIFGLTLFKTYSTRRQAGSGSNLPIHMLIARDGALYFAVMALANLANIITFWSPGTLVRGCLSTFANCVSVSMMSRLMLNLHEKTSIGILSQINEIHLVESIPVEFREHSQDQSQAVRHPTPDPSDISVVP